VAIPNVVIVETSGCNVLLNRDIFQNRDQYIILYLLGIPNMGSIPAGSVGGYLPGSRYYLPAVGRFCTFDIYCIDRAGL
jgi:hypothetical protein